MLNCKKYRLQAILSLGIPGEQKEPEELDNIPVEKIHWEQY